MKKAIGIAVVALVATSLFGLDPAAVYKQKKCADCHGADGSKAIPEKGVKPINVPAVLDKSEDELVAVLTKANPKMTADEIRALAKFVKTFKSR